MRIELKQRGLGSSLVLILFGCMAGCRSRGINVTIVNTGHSRLRNLELDYPGGSFGRPSLPPNAPYRYRIKITKNGKLKLLFEEAEGKAHSENGPEVHAGDDGAITLTIDENEKPHWQTNVQPE